MLRNESVETRPGAPVSSSNLGLSYPVFLLSRVWSWELFTIQDLCFPFIIIILGNPQPTARSWFLPNMSLFFLFFCFVLFCCALFCLACEHSDERAVNIWWSCELTVWVEQIGEISGDEVDHFLGRAMTMNIHEIYHSDNSLVMSGHPRSTAAGGPLFGQGGPGADWCPGTLVGGWRFHFCSQIHPINMAWIKTLVMSAPT